MIKADVVIIGGGPSGTAAAIVLARSGLEVILVERTSYDRERVGETFPPDICVPLQELGLWERFKNAGHQVSPGIISCWGSSEPYENDFVFNPFGNGWHVDRRRFDRMLAEAAREVGVRVFLSTCAKSCSRDDEVRWTVQANQGGNHLQFRATYVVDATGRARGPSSSGPQCRRYDRLVGCVTFLHSSQDRNTEPRAIIESCSDGWWYSTSLPRGKLVIAFMTDFDLIPKGHKGAINFFWRRLQESQLTARWLDSFCPDRVILRLAADTYSRQILSTNRLAVGDAAMAFDPLSSQGVLKALVSGQAAAKAVLAARAGDAQASEKYVAGLEAEFLTYVETRLSYYRMEQRWPNSPFWQRRHTSVV